MTTRKLTVRLPEDNLDFIKGFAAEHGLTVTEVLDRYLTRLREGPRRRGMNPGVERLSGLVPPEIDAEVVYREHVLRKHR